MIGPDGEPIEDLLLSPRIAPAVFGVGLLEAVPEDDILDLADPDDDDGDGISGRANLVPDPAAPGNQVLGRFGWKAAVPTVEEQNAGAFAGDIGITSSLRPDQPCTRLQAECISAPDGRRPRARRPQARPGHLLHAHARRPGPARRRHPRHRAPVRRPSRSSAARRATSASCTPATATSRRSTDQVIRPYTDLLLHDMGTGAGRRPSRARRDGCGGRHAGPRPQRPGVAHPAAVGHRPGRDREPATPASSTTAAPAASRRPSSGTAARPSRPATASARSTPKIEPP